MKQNRTNDAHNESGNALWIILMAVALLAALTATISRSTDTAEQSGNIERFRVHASDMMRFSGGVAQSVDTMRLHSIGENQMSFQNTDTATNYTNANCLNSECLVFSSVGGGATYHIPNTAWLDPNSSGSPRYGEWEFTGDSAVPGIRSASPDLVMYVGYLRQGLCEQINTMLDITGVPLDAGGFDTTAFQGNFAIPAGGTIDMSPANIESGCFQDTGTSARGYTYYHVLIKR